MDVPNLERYLNSFGASVVKQARGILGGVKGNTALASTIRFEVQEEAQGYSTKFYMADYGTFLDKGVSGNTVKRSYKNWQSNTLSSPYKYTNKQPPPDILAKWIKKKGIKGRDPKTGRFISNMSLAFIIGRKIKRDGIQGISFFQKPLGLEFRKLKDEIMAEFKVDVEAYITTYTKF
jgi:hypothetical protein